MIRNGNFSANHATLPGIQRTPERPDACDYMSRTLDRRFGAQAVIRFRIACKFFAFVALLQ
jgi:hypothetical protein